MPELPPVTRRSALRLLALGVVGAAAGCRGHQPQAGSATTAPGPSRTAVPPSATGAPTGTVAPAPASPTTDPTAQAAARNEHTLIAAYDDVMRTHPDLASALRGPRADHAAHLKALDPAAVLSPPPVPSSAAPSSPLVTPAASTPPASGSVPPTTPAASPSTAAVLAELTDLESRAAAARLDDMATASGTLAAVLASIGGCEAAHAATLATVLAST